MLDTNTTLTERIAADQIAERIRRADRSRIPGVYRPRGRHALAARLHRFAERLDQ